MPGMDLSYQASRFYVEVREACGNRKHQLDSSYCRNCRLYVALLESTVEEVQAEQPEPDTTETNELLDNIARIIKQEALAWAAGCPTIVQSFVGVIGGHIAREILKLKEPPPVPTMVETLAGEKKEYVRAWEPKPFHGASASGDGKVVPWDPVLRAPEAILHTLEDSDG